METEDRISPEGVQDVRRSRRRPRPTQFDYLHLRHLLKDLRRVLEFLPGQVGDVLDIYCGSRPYEDLLPIEARCVGLDINDRYGVADIVTEEFLPFSDESFDLVMCTEAFHYVEDPRQGVAEIWRVLRPTGTVIITVPLVWEYNRTILEHRYTGPELAALFRDWNNVKIVENGGRAVSWALLTGSVVHIVERCVPKPVGLRWLIQGFFSTIYLIVNAMGFLLQSLLDRAEDRGNKGIYTLPANLLLTARRPTE
jgi:SAM-dependent methyltransferase